MALVKLPSVQVDAVNPDSLDATRGTILSTIGQPFVLADAQTLIVDVDGGGGQVIAFNAVDFANIALASADEVVNVITNALTGAFATNESGQIRITTDTYGTTGSVEVTGGTAAAAFGFPGGAQAGTDATPQYTLINRIPEPGEIEVPQSSGIQIDIYEYGGGGGGVPVTLIEVTVEGVLAYDGDGGGFQAGFTGTVTAGLSTGLTRIVINPDTDFTSKQVVDVDVDIDGGAYTESYSFTAQDTEAPQISAVDARSKTVVRVTYAEPVKQTSASDADDALNPANYALLRQSVPAVNVVPVSVAAVDASTVDVTVDVEMTFGAPYRITIGNVADLEGNPFVAPANYVDFIAFIPDFPAGRRFRLIEFIPLINREEDVSGELHLTIAIFQEVTNLILCEIDEWTNIIDPDLAPEAFVDAMLADMGNPFGRFDLEEVDKRRLLRNLISFYQLKGTERGIINAIRFFLGIEVAIDIFNGEGWELTDTPNRVAGPGTTGSSPSFESGIAEVIDLQETLIVELNGVVVSTSTSGSSEGEVGDELNDADGTLGVPPAILGPSPAGLYSFCILSPVDLTLEQAESIVFLANYLKPAHTHLVCIVQPNEPTFDTSGLGVEVVSVTGPAFDHVELGFSELGGGAGQPGTWILH